MNKYVINKSQVLALIPARGGSKGVPGKNIKLLKGYPLIAYSIVLCKLCKTIDRVIVTTDSDEIADISMRYDAEVPFLRPAEISGDKAEDITFVKHALEWLQENEGSVPEYIAHIRPTTPLREVALVDKAILFMKEHTNYSSLRSAHEASESPYKWFVRNGECFQSIVGDLDNDAANNGRQQFPTAYIPDGYIDVLQTEYIIRNNRLHGTMMYGFVSPMCYEVDTEEDFQLLEYQIEKKEVAIYKYMESRYQ